MSGPAKGPRGPKPLKDGLGSLLARFDAMGGSMHLTTGPGRGTEVTAVSPPEPSD